MTLKGKGVNLQVLAECVCYLLFGWLVFRLTQTGQYLNYVTPRMKPYLYGLSALMLLWAVAQGRYLLTPQYRLNLGRTFVFLIPILLIAARPAVPEGSSMVRNYNSSGFLIAGGNGGGPASGGLNGQPSTPDSGGGPAPSYEEETDPAWDYETSDDYETGADSETDGYSKTDGYSETDEYTEDTTDQSSEDESPWYDLNGLNEETKTITIADEDYYTWMYELGSFYEKYEGYTVIMKGFVYRDPEIQKTCDFALVRLSMWCCAADLSPMGFMVSSDGEVNFKDDDWVVVKGTLGITEDGNSVTLKAQSIEAAEKPEEEYVYPYF